MIGAEGLLASAAARHGPGGLARRAGRAIGSALQLTIATDEPTADAAWLAVEQTFADVDAAMSRFREDSDLTRLNRRGRPDEGVPRMLVRALAAADRARRVTGGRFDPRIVGALERIGYGGVPQGVAPGGPPPEQSDRVFTREGRRGAVSVAVPIDLGGIGKGLALRWAATAIDHVLETAGPESADAGYLLDAGGDIVVAGTPAPGEPWHVGIEDPGGDPAPVATLKASGRLAIATSSTRQLRWQHDGRDVHHLIDPRTGEPGGRGLVAVTVAGPDPAWAEVWSKALFLEGSAGIAAMARLNDLTAWWATTDGAFEMTPAARQRTIWVAAEV